jgi:hypothetical protein
VPAKFFQRTSKPANARKQIDEGERQTFHFDSTSLLRPETEWAENVLAYLSRDVAANGLNRLNRIRLTELTCVSEGTPFWGVMRREATLRAGKRCRV